MTAAPTPASARRLIDPRLIDPRLIDRRFIDRMASPWLCPSVFPVRVGAGSEPQPSGK
jgi:hypothetical protein